MCCITYFRTKYVLYGGSKLLRRPDYAYFALKSRGTFTLKLINIENYSIHRKDLLKLLRIKTMYMKLALVIFQSFGVDIP